MADQTVTFCGNESPVRVLPLGQLQRCAVAFNRAGINLGRGVFDEQTMADVSMVVAAGINQPLDAFAELPVRLDELIDAFTVVADVAGMLPKTGEERAVGKPAALSTGTPSTAT